MTEQSGGTVDTCQCPEGQLTRGQYELLIAIFGEQAKCSTCGLRIPDPQTGRQLSLPPYNDIGLCDACGAMVTDEEYELYHNFGPCPDNSDEEVDNG